MAERSPALSALANVVVEAVAVVVSDGVTAGGGVIR
jgi:hypothetical protein